MADVTLKIKGSKELQRLFRVMPKELTKNITLLAAKEVGMKTIVPDAKSSAPRDSGQVAESIGVVKTKDVVWIGPRLGRRFQGHKARWLEKGTKERLPKKSQVLRIEFGGTVVYTRKAKGLRARPFMRPAIDRNFNKLQQGIEKANAKKAVQVMRRTVKKAGGVFIG